jgi:transposase
MRSEKARVWRTVSEKRRIVELTLQPGMSVARVAQSEGVNSHQVFQWRRAYRDGTLGDTGMGSRALLPVIVAENGEQPGPPCDKPAPACPPGSIHIELPGRALITAESGADAALLRAVLESLRQ